MVDGDCSSEVQFCPIDSISETVVELSAITCNVVFCVADWNGAWKSGPPGREELFVSPY